MARSIVVFNKGAGRYERIHEGAYNYTVGRPYTPEKYCPQLMKKYPTEERYNRAIQREYDRMLEDIRDVEMAGDLDEAIIEVRWTDRPGVMGYQADARVDYSYIDRAGKMVYGSVKGPRTSGYGFDKESTAMAYAMDMVPEMRKVAYDRLDEPEGSRSVDYKPIPRFRGGAGPSVIVDDFRRSGYDVDKLYTGDGDRAPDIYTIRRRRESNENRRSSGGKSKGRLARLFRRSD